MHELDCLECVAYDRMRAANPVAERVTDPAQPQSTHCIRGHEWTEASTRIEKRPNRPSPIRTCRTCHNERLKAARAKRRAGTTQPREPGGLDRGRAAPTGRMTMSTLPPGGAT
jgi:IS5 family transposase